MYVQLKSSYQIVTLPDDFLTLKHVNEDELIFELKYLFDQELAIKSNTLNVSVDVAKNPPPRISPTGDPKNVLRDIQRQKSIHTQHITDYFQNDLITSITSDPTKYVNNEVISLFHRGYTSSQLPQLRKRSLVPTRVEDAKNPVTLVYAQHDVGSTSTSQKLAEELLLGGFDPSSSYEVNDLGLSLAESHRGIHQRSPTVFNSEVEKTLYKYKVLPFLAPISQTSAGDAGVVITGETSDQFTLERASIDGRRVEVTDLIKFKLPVSSPDKLVLVLKVKDSSGVTTQVVERVFHPREYIKYYSIPRLPPVVRVNTQSNKTHVMLCIKQVDPAATRVRVYKRVYDNFAVGDDPYVLVSEFDIVPSTGWVYLPVEVSLGNTIVYRVVPISALGTYGSDFATVVVKPKMRNPSIKRVVVTTKPQLNGVFLEVSKLPSDCVTFHISREDVTIKGPREFVGSPTQTESSDSNHVYTIVDANVKQGHVYVYHCRIFRKSGSFEDRLVTYYEHVALVEDIVETKINDPSLFLTDRGYDVKFTITTTVVNTKVDQIKRLLERQGLYEIFKSDVADVRDQLGKLIAHNVKRVDLTTGAIEDFGTIDKVIFSDLDARNVTGVSELRLGHKYRYIVTALLRTPETLLETFVKTARDVTTNREYSFKPFKFLHPLVAKYGNIVTPSSIRTNYSKDPMTFGEIGNYTFVEIALDKQKSIVTSAVREKMGSDTDVLRWVLTGTSKDVDHFQIVVDHGGKKSVIGKATCVPETENFLYVRKLDQTDVGLDLRYYVCPVYLDFTRGVEVLVSNIEDNS